MKSLALLILLTLTACAHRPLAAEQKATIDRVAVVALLGDELALDFGSSEPLLKWSHKQMDAKAWKLNEGFAELIAQNLGSSKMLVPLELDPQAVAKALAVRESRWKRVTGRYSQALLDLVFAKAEAKGAHFLFLLLPNQDAEFFPLQPGTMGVYCPERKPDSPARAYFKFEFSLWDVPARKKIFTAMVDPKSTAGFALMNCQTAQNPAAQLEAPVKLVMASLVNALFAEMGWGEAKAAPALPAPPPAILPPVQPEPPAF